MKIRYLASSCVIRVVTRFKKFLHYFNTRLIITINNEKKEMVLLEQLRLWCILTFNSSRLHITIVALSFICHMITSYIEKSACFVRLPRGLRTKS